MYRSAASKVAEWAVSLVEGKVAWLGAATAVKSVVMTVWPKVGWLADETVATRVAARVACSVALMVDWWAA